jgi:hypothetical protein
MARLPRTHAERIQFYQSHLAPWQESREVLGLTPAQMQALTERVARAKEMFAALQAQRSALLSAGIAFRAALADLNATGGAAMNTIHARAKSAKDPLLYTLAHLPIPQPAAPQPAPRKPYQQATHRTQHGQQMLRWQCKSPRRGEGTLYEIQRRLDGGPDQWLAVVGKRQFTDDTIPPGTAELTYTITAVRCGKRGLSAAFPLNLGSAMRAAERGDGGGQGDKVRG